MKTIKRFMFGVSAKMEELVGQMENHEAVAASMIAEAQRSAAAARIQLGRVRADRDRLHTRLGQLTQSEKQWKVRARKMATENEDGAIECVRRIKQVRKDIEQTTRDAAEVDEVERKLRKVLAEIEDKIRLLRRKKHALRCRQSCAEAVEVVSCDGLGRADEIDELLTRWETSVVEKEIRFDIDHHHDVDEFARTFENEEQRDELKQMLDEIIVTADLDPASQGGAEKEDIPS